MGRFTQKVKKSTSVRLTADDLQIVAKLSKKLGVGLTPIVRLALRALERENCGPCAE